MKKKTKPAALFAALAAIALFTAPTAHAAETANNWNPYIGADYQRMQAEYKDDNNDALDKSLNAFNVHAGIRPFQNFGAEIGYFQSNTGKRTTTDYGRTQVKIRGITLDAMGYLPVNDRVDLIGTGGVVRSTAKFSQESIASDSESETSWRAGVGAQARLTDNLNIRSLARYQKADFDDNAKHIWVYTAGVNYRF